MPIAHIRCTGLHLGERRSQARANTASRGHMLLYIPIRITWLWNVRKCVVSASASSAGPPQHPARVWPPSSQGLCPHRQFPLQQKQEPLHPVGPLSHRPFSASRSFMAQPSSRPADGCASLPDPTAHAHWQREATSPKGFHTVSPQPPSSSLQSFSS